MRGNGSTFVVATLVTFSQISGAAPEKFVPFGTHTHVACPQSATIDNAICANLRSSLGAKKEKPSISLSPSSARTHREALKGASGKLLFGFQATGFFIRSPSCHPIVDVFIESAWNL